MRLKDNLNTYTTRQLRTVGIETIKVTREILGHGNKPVPKFKINNRLSSCYGQYDYEYNITINPSNCGTMEMFIRTVIHEYTHHIQKGLKRNYDSSVKKNGYHDSPFEIEARGNELKYKSVVWKNVKRTLNQMC
jgi:hypothetical protein